MINSGDVEVIDKQPHVFLVLARIEKGIRESLNWHICYLFKVENG